MAHLQELELFSSSVLNSPVTNGILACNPTVDLLGTASDANVVNIWRARGQLVAKHVERNNKIEALRWKPDGQYLATGWSDGVLRLLGFENAKAAHQIHVFEKGQSKFAYIAWSRNRLSKRGKESASKFGDSWAKLPDGDPEAENSKADVLSLPEELTFIEVDTALPKLSPLPLSGGSGADMLVFASRNSIDFIFRPFKAEDTNNVDVTMAGTMDGQVQISIYDSFIVGKFDYQPSDAPASAGAMQLCCHSSHLDVSTHALLFKAQPTESGVGDSAIHMVPADLTFIHSSPVNLSLLATKTTMLQNILRYIKQTQLHMVSEWKESRELPGRFMAGVREDLLKLDKGRNIVQALYHTVVTGHLYPPVKEWLLDTVAERGHKRWDKAVTSGLENLRALIHENMIPALQRAAIILSRLRGIARFEEHNNDIGFTAAQISKLMDITQCLYAVSYKVLRLIMKELLLFGKFSSWLRLEIDKQASSTMSDELLERQANLDFPKVLKYIKDHLTTSPIKMFFDDVEKEDHANSWDRFEDGAPLREMLEKQINLHQTGQPYMKAVPRLEFLVDYMISNSESVLKAIAETQRRRVRFATATKLEVDGQITGYDVRMCAKRKQGGLDGRVFTALASDKAQHEVLVFRTDLEIINGISSPVLTGVTRMPFPKEGKIVDFKFLDDRSLLVLWMDPESKPVLISMPYQSLPYANYANRQIPEPSHFKKEDFGPLLTAGRLGDSTGFTPVHMEVVQGSSLRGDIPARVCLLGKDKVTCKVYSIPQEWEWKGDTILGEDSAMESWLTS